MKQKLLICDCDGVLTPRHSFYSENGKVLKMFCSDDSYAIKKFKKIGYKVIIMTIDSDGYKITKKRCQDWNVDPILTDDKAKEIEIIKKSDLYDCIIYVGNAPEDLLVIDYVDIFVAPKDSRSEVINFQNSKLKIVDVNGGDGVLDSIFAIIQK